MRRIVREGNRGRLLSSAAGAVCATLEELLAARADVNLAVPGGRSVSEIFTAMREARVDWGRVHLFVVDERLVPLGHPESNFGLIEEHLVGPLVQAGRIEPENAHPFLFDPASPDRGVKRYEETLAAHGFRYDVLLLSAGEDGHVGALYPHHHSIEDPHHGFILMDDSPKPPPGRMSSSLSLLQTASAAFLLFVGEGKRGAWEGFNDERCSVVDCPAKLVLELPSATIFTDLTEAP